MSSSVLSYYIQLVWKKLELTNPEFPAQFKTEKKLNSASELILSFSSQTVKQHHPVEKLVQMRPVSESVFTPAAVEAAALAHFCIGTTSGGYF